MKEPTKKEAIEKIITDTVDAIVVNHFFEPENEENNDNMFDLRLYYEGRKTSADITRKIKIDLTRELENEEKAIPEKIKKDKWAVIEMCLASVAGYAIGPFLETWVPGLFLTGMTALYAGIVHRREKAFEREYTRINYYKSLIKVSDRTWNSVLEEIKPDIKIHVGAAYKNKHKLTEESKNVLRISTQTCA